jgi:hypothetical protein
MFVGNKVSRFAILDAPVPIQSLKLSNIGLDSTWMGDPPKSFMFCWYPEEFLSQHHILPYLFVNTLFNTHSIGSAFTKFGYENDKLFV